MFRKQALFTQGLELVRLGLLDIFCHSVCAAQSCNHSCLMMSKMTLFISLLLLILCLCFCCSSGCCMTSSSYSTAYQCIYYPPEQTAKAREILRVVSQLQPHISALADQLLQTAQRSSSQPLRDVLKSLEEKVRPANAQPEGIQLIRSDRKDIYDVSKDLYIYILYLYIYSIFIYVCIFFSSFLIINLI